MQMDVLFKLAGLGLVVAVISQILTRTGREELSMLVTVAGLVIALLMVVTMVSELLTAVKSIFQLY